MQAESLQADEKLSDIASSSRRNRSGVKLYDNPVPMCSWLRVETITSRCSETMLKQLLCLKGCISPMMVLDKGGHCLFRCHVRALHTSQHYLVVLAVSATKWGSSCGCPIGLRTNEVCKHATAALLLVAKLNDPAGFEKFLNMLHEGAHDRIVEYTKKLRSNTTILASLPQCVKVAFDRIVARHKQAYQEKKRLRVESRVDSQPDLSSTSPPPPPSASASAAASSSSSSAFMSASTSSSSSASESANMVEARHFVLLRGTNRNICLELPAFLKGRSQLPREEANSSGQFTTFRNKVERRIETLKINRLLDGEVRRVSEPDLMDWFKIAAALIYFPNRCLVDN